MSPVLSQAELPCRAIGGATTVFHVKHNNKGHMILPIRVHSYECRTARCTWNTYQWACSSLRLGPPARATVNATAGATAFRETLPRQVVEVTSA